MRRVGPFEIERDLYRRGFWTVSVAARADGAGGTRYAVKWMERPEAFLGRERAEALTIEFAAAAEAQRLIADSGGAHWAAVEYGHFEGGVYRACEYRPRSCAQLVAGRFVFDDESAAWLRGVVLGVLEGIREARDGAGRGHGNLKPGNVLLGSRSGWRADDVALCDPSPDAPAEGEHGDLVALGRLIHLLVLHREFHPLGGWPIERSAAWDRLGPRLGEAWRSLCGRLLDPSGASGTLTVEGVRAAVESLPTPWTRRKRGRVRRAAIAAGVLALSVAGWQGYIVVERLVNPFDPVKWRELCEANDDWLAPLRDHIDGLDAARRALWVSDEHLREIVMPLASKRGNDPARLALALRDPGGPRRDLIDLPQRDLERSRKDINAAHEDKVRLVEALVSPDWRLPLSLEAGAGVLDARGWERPAAEARALADTLRSGPGPGLGGVIDRGLEAAELLEAVRDDRGGVLARIDAASRAASESGLDALGGFGRAADEAVRGAVAAERPLAALSASVREFGEAADRIVVFVRDGWPLVDRWALEEHSETIAALRAGERAADAAFFKALIAEAGDERFRVLAPETNPTHGWDVAERAARMAAGLDDLRRSPDTDEGLTGRIAELSGRASEAAERARAASEMRWNWFTRAEVRGLAAEVSSLVGALESEYEGARAEVAERAEAWVREVRAQRARFGAGPLDAEWAARRDELLSGAERDGDYVGMRRRFAAMEGVLERVGEVIGGSGSLTTPPRLVRYDPQALLGAVRARSGHAAEPAIRAARWDGDGYANADEMVEIARAHTAAAQEWYDTLREMILAMDAVQGRLDDFYLLDRAPAGAASASSLLDTWVGHPVFDEVNGSEVFRDLLEYAERVRALGRETDRMVLASVATESDEPAHAYAAWARLGELRDPDWPRTPGELAREAEAAGRIVGAVSAVGDAGWRAALEREIAEAGRVRWTRCAEAARTEADLLACFDRREGFGVEESDLSPRLRYNLALLRLREAAQPEADESFVESAAGAFVEEVSGLPAGYAGRADALGVAGRVSRTVEEWRSGPGRVDFSRLGPGVLGWGAEPNDDDTMVAFEWRGERRARNAPAVPRLEFVRVDLSDEAVFISRDEVSLALMRGWLRSEQWEELIPVLSLEQDNASWTGPRGWLWPGQPRNGLILNSGRPRERDMWLAQNVEVTANSPQYAPGIGDPADHVRIASQFRPTEAHPVQHVSPVGASKFAETLGCRLPSAEEWLGALRRHEDVGGAVWNLRDETFALQRDHAREMIERRLAAGAVRANFRYPDEGAFVPDGVRVDRGAEARVYPGNDGSLWFQRADQGPGRMLRHMIGNVAEFVTVVGSDGSVRYAVIGGSAMSAPELELDRPYPIPARLNSETYADVGFRLAFGAGEIRVRLGRQLADAISGVGFDLSGRGG